MAEAAAAQLPKAEELLDANLTLAEEVATMMSRRELNSRDRDFAEVWTISRVYSFSAADVRDAITAFASHRRQRAVDLVDGQLVGQESSLASPARLRWCMYFIVVCTSAWPIHACTCTMVAGSMAIEPN